MTRILPILLLTLLSPLAHSQGAYPVRPIRIIITVVPGGGMPGGGKIQIP